MDILTPQSQEPSNLSTQPTGALAATGNIKAMDINQYFELAPFMTSDSVNYILEFAVSRGLTSKGDIYQMLRDIEGKVSKDGDRLTNVHRYLKLLNQIEDLNKVRNTMEHDQR